MAKTLRGSMIVGYYKQSKEDFSDHGQIVTIDDEGVHFECKTTPYGFVSPDAKVWFQTFSEISEDGEMVEREYLMTTGYLWTKAFPEANKVIEEGRPQSMELDSDSVKGAWTNSVKNDYEILIINDAVFSKLCILGEDVEPCFEGASVTKPDISTSFSLDDGFKNTVYTMMKELQQFLQGGNIQMDKDNLNLESPVVEAESTQTAYVKKDDEEDKKTNEGATSENKDNSENDKSAPVAENKDGGDAKKEEDDEKKKSDKYSMENAVSIEEYNALKDKYSSLESTVAALTKFKNEAELEKKNALIDKFTMLSEDDKAEVVTNINNYSLDEIESKLSVKCFRKGIFVSTDSDKNDNNIVTKVEDNVITYSLAGNAQQSDVPEWIRAVEQNSKT